MFTSETSSGNVGQQAVGSTSATQVTVTFTFTSGGSISAPVVLTEGATNLDFQDAGSGTCTTLGLGHVYANNDTCTVVVSFKPTAPGLRLGAVQLYANGAVIATAPVYGTGSGPLAQFPEGGTQITAGSGLSAPGAVAVNGQGDVFATIATGLTSFGIAKIAATGGVVSSGSTVSTLVNNLGSPSYGIAVDGAGDVFYTDFPNNAVDEIVAVNGVVTSSSTVTTLSPSVSGPGGIAVDGLGNVFVVSVSPGSAVVYEIPAVNGAPGTSTIAVGTGWVLPASIAVDGDGNLFVTDAQTSVLNFDNSGNVIEVTPVGGVYNSSSTMTVVATGMNSPEGLAVDGGGNLYVANVMNQSGMPVGVVTEFQASDGVVTTSSNSVTINTASIAPNGVATDGKGNFYVSDLGLTYIAGVALTTPPSLSFATSSVNATSSDSPKYVTLRNAGNAALSIATVTASSASFPLDSSNACITGGMVQEDATCMLAVDFKPAAGGSLTGMVTIQDNSLNVSSSSQVVNLSGTGIASLSATTQVANTSLTQNRAATPFTPVTGSGGTSPLSYSVLPTLPAGLSMSTTTGQITGTPMAASSATTYKVTVTDANSATATNTFSLAVNSAVVATQAVASTTLTQNQAAAAFTPVTGSGGTAPLSYSVSTALPAGLSMSSTTGQITGTPMAASSATTYTVTITDANGATATNTFSLTVVAPAPTVTNVSPNNGPYTVTTAVTITGTNFNNVTAVAFGSVAASSYSVNSGTSISAVAPAQSAGMVNVIVTTAGGSSAPASGDQFTYYSSQSYTVTTLTDDATGVPANCPSGSTTSNCSLRDAIAAFNAQPAGITVTIGFAPSLTSSATAANPAVYSVAANGTLSITGPGTLTINGPTTGSGSSLANLLAIDGGNAQRVLYLGSSGQVNLSGLIIRNGDGSAAGDGGGIFIESGTVTVTNSTVSGNAALGGGGIYAAAGTLTVTNSTISGNTAVQDDGGGILIDTATSTVTNSTISGNSANEYGGGIYENSGPLAVTNSTISGNTAGMTGGDGYTAGPTPVFKNSVISSYANATVPTGQGNVTGPVMLAPLGNYGGPTQTMPPLPGGSAICVGSASAAAGAGITSDQRGVALSLTTANAGTYTGAGGYCPAGSIDAGAVQTDYAIAFTTLLPSGLLINTVMGPPPAVTVTESGNTATAVGSSISVSDADNSLSSSATKSATAVSGVAIFSNLQFANAVYGDTLTATLALGSGISVTATSSIFNVDPPAATVTIASPASVTFSPATQTVTLTARVTASGTPVTTGTVTFTVLNGSTPVGSAVTSSTLNSNGSASVSYSLPAGTAAGTYTILAVFNPGAGYTSSNDRSQELTVSQATPTIAISGLPVSAYTGGSFTPSFTYTGDGTASVSSQTSSVCTVSSGVVSFVVGGTCTLQASATAGTNYAAVTGPAQSFLIGLAEPVGSTSATQTATVTITTAGMLGQINVLTQGAANKDFALVSGGSCATSTTYTVNQTCTVEFTFSPSRPGQRPGAISLTTGSSGTVTVLGTASIYGMGTGPLAAFPGSSTANSLATLPNALGELSGIAVDGNGNVYILDQRNGQVDEIVAVNGVIPSSPTLLTLAGGFNYPNGLAVDGSGNLYVADTLNGQVKEIVAVNGVIPQSPSVVTLGSVTYPWGVAVDGSGDLYVSDTGSHSVKEMVAVNGSIPSNPTILTLASIDLPQGVAVDASGNVYVAELFSSHGQLDEIQAVNGVIPPSPAILTLSSSFNSPVGVALDGSGNVYVAEAEDQQIKEVVAVNGTIPSSNPVILTLNGLFGDNWGVAVDGGGHVFVADVVSTAVKELDLTQPPALSFANTFTGLTSSDSPKSLTVQNDGNQPLSFGSIGLTAGTPNFTLGSAGTCSSTTPLAESGTCTVAASFSPTTAGSPDTGAITLTDNSLNQSSTTQVIQLSGTATVPAATTTSASAATATYSPSSQNVTLTAAVVAGATPVTTGTVTFTVLNGSTPVGSAVTSSTLSSSGTASVIYSLPAAAAPAVYTIQAVYNPGTGFVGSSDASHQLTVNKASPLIAWSIPSSIAYGANLSGILIATASYGGSTLPGGFTYTATPTGGTASTVTASTVLGAGSYTITATFTPTDTTDYQAASPTAALMVEKSTATISIASSLNPAIVTGSVTFTATLNSSAGAPTGSIGFYDGTTLLATIALSGGSAAYTTSSLATGTHSIMAIYPGDSNFTSVTSAAVSEVIQDFSIGTSGGSGSQSTPSQTVLPGGTATFNFIVLSLSKPINFLVSGLPPGATGTVNPPTLPAGSGSSSVTLTIQLPQTSQLERQSAPFRNGAPLLLGLLLLPFARNLRRHGKRLCRMLMLIVVAAGAVATMGLNGCSGSSGFFAQAPQTYTITVTATCEGVSRSTNVTLIVE